MIEPALPVLNGARTMAVECSFVVPGAPVPKARPRIVRNRHTGKAHGITPKRTETFESLVRLVAASARPSGWPLRCAYKVEIHAVRACARRGDCSNLAKSIEDGCNTVTWADDEQIVELHVKRSQDRENPRTEVRVTALPVRCKLIGCGGQETYFPDEQGRCETCAAKRTR